MTKQEFRQLLENGPIILDGAMGTGLMKAGMPVDACTEEWAIEHPEVVVRIQKEYIDMKSRAGSYRLTHSAQEYATYERKMGTYKTLWESNEELASYYDDISYYSLTKFHSIENRSTVYFIVSAALFLGTIGAFVWLRTSKKRTVPSNQEQTNALQEFYCPQCNSPVQLNDPACKKCGQIFDWSKQ